jgi:hypothetical protein
MRDLLLALGARTTDAFRELTNLAERALYGRWSPVESDVSRARELADRSTETER